MYARINYVDINPELFDECDVFWREVISRYPGMELAYWLRDGDTAHTLSFIFFESEVAMHAHNDGEFAEVLRQAARFRLSEPQLHPMEVCAMLAPDQPSNAKQARVLDAQIDPAEVDTVIAQWRAGTEAYRDESGFVGAYLCCDRASGRAKSVSFWKSAQDREANERSGAFKAAVEASKGVYTAPPKTSYWSVRIVV